MNGISSKINGFIYLMMKTFTDSAALECSLKISHKLLLFLCFYYGFVLTKPLLVTMVCLFLRLTETTKIGLEYICLYVIFSKTSLHIKYTLEL